MTSAFNLVTRAAVVTAKGVLAVVLVRALPLEEFGRFSLIWAAAAVATYLLGLDLYTVSGRELPRASRARVAAIVQAQAGIHLATYAVFAPWLGAMFYLDVLPREHVSLIAALLPLEHFTHECFRWLVALERHLAANSVLLAKSVLWIAPVALAPHGGLRRLLVWWLGGLLLALAAALVALARAGALTRAREATHWRAPLGSFRQAAYFYVCTVASLLATYGNRFFLKFFTGDDADVGIFSLFASLANLLEVTVQAAVLQAAVPRVIAARDARAAGAAFRRLSRDAVLVTTFMTILLIALFRPLLAILGRPELYSNVAVYFVLLAGSFMAALGLVPQTRLYVAHSDRAQMWCSLAALAASVGLNLLLVRRWGIAGAAAATTAGLMTGSLLRWWAVRVTGSVDSLAPAPSGAHL